MHLEIVGTSEGRGNVLRSVRLVCQVDAQHQRPSSPVTVAVSRRRGEHGRLEPADLLGHGSGGCTLPVGFSAGRRGSRALAPIGVVLSWCRGSRGSRRRRARTREVIHDQVFVASDPPVGGVEVPMQALVVAEPPERGLGQHEVRGPLRTQLLDVVDR